MMELPPTLRCWYLTGPTASGKTGLGVSLARRLGAEIISLDSMALYRGMDIGTAKPTPEEREDVPHHLIDVIDPHEDFSVAQYRDAALRLIGEITARGRRILFVGGTPLYLKAMVRGVFEGPSADWQYRKMLQAQAEKEPAQWLHQQLATVDPATAARLHPNDTRRLVRALEVFHLTGTPISVLQQEHQRGHAAKDCRVFTLAWPRDVLHRRIELRVDAMFAEGLVDEVRGLLKGPKPLGRTASQAVGYREVAEHLRGTCELDEAVQTVKAHTRRLARRQETWFRSLSECRSVNVASPPLGDASGFDIDRAADLILDLGGRKDK